MNIRTLTSRLSHSSLVGATALLACLAMVLAGGTALGQESADQPLARVELSSTGLDLRPQVSASAWQLTVSGPDGFYFEETFADSPSFSLGDIGAQPQDGEYDWELRPVLELDERTRSQLQDPEVVADPERRARLADELRESGKLPDGPGAQSGTFHVKGGQISTLTREAEPGAPLGSTGNTRQTIAESLCVGIDCPGTPSFDDTTILMMENNTRIKFDDTSTTSSFPRNDWELRANDNANGGSNRFSIADCGQSAQGGCADTLVFSVEAGAGSNALHVDNIGRLGLGTSTPVVEIHSVDGDTPTLRLAQDGSSGFTPQTWDVAGNESNFFVRDGTGGSALPFRIRPGAPTNSIIIQNDGDVGMGVFGAQASLHVERSDGTASLLVKETSSTEFARNMATFSNQGTAVLRFDENRDPATNDWHFGLKTNNRFIITTVGSIGSPLWQMDSSGNVTATSFTPSARDLKTDLAPVDGSALLERVGSLPLSTWKYKRDKTGAVHLGPMAEDFHAAFGLGKDTETIAPADLAGVALAAVQALREQVGELQQRNAELEARIERLEAMIVESASRETSSTSRR